MESLDTIFLDGSRYESGKAVHRALRQMLHLPPYYGGNADALHDCLSERTAPPSLVVMAVGQGEVAETLEKVIRVFEVLGSQVKRLDNLAKE